MYSRDYSRPDVIVPWFRKTWLWRKLQRYKNWRAVIKRNKYLKLHNIASGIDMKQPLIKVYKPFRRW